VIEPDDGWDVVFAYGSRTHLVYAPEEENKTLCGMTVPKFLDGHAHSPVWESDALMATAWHSGGPWRDLQDAVDHRVNCRRCLKAWRKRFG
jgi:hypothetical protein